MLYYRYVRIALLTFAFGLASFNFSNWAREYIAEIPLVLPHASSSILEVTIAPPLTEIEVIAHGCGGHNEFGAETAVTSFRIGDFSNIGVVSSEGYDNKKGALREIAVRISEAN